MAESGAIIFWFKILLDILCRIIYSITMSDQTEIVNQPQPDPVQKRKRGRPPVNKSIEQKRAEECQRQRRYYYAHQEQICAKKAAIYYQKKQNHAISAQ